MKLDLSYWGEMIGLCGWCLSVDATKRGWSDPVRPQPLMNWRPPPADAIAFSHWLKPQFIPPSISFDFFFFIFISIHFFFSLSLFFSVRVCRWTPFLFLLSNHAGVDVYISLSPRCMAPIAIQCLSWNNVSLMSQTVSNLLLCHESSHDYGEGEGDRMISYRVWFPAAIAARNSSINPDWITFICWRWHAAPDYANTWPTLSAIDSGQLRTRFSRILAKSKGNGDLMRFNEI